MTATKMKPITLRAGEVRELAATGGATIRRPVKQPAGDLSGAARVCLRGRAYPDLFAWCDGHPDDIETWGVVGDPFFCPLGRVGERRWVREEYCDRAIYGAVARLRSDRFHYAADGKKSGWAYSNAITMPREAGRFDVEVAAVSVEPDPWRWAVEIVRVDG